jgi:hypothetical protein
MGLGGCIMTCWNVVWLDSYIPSLYALSLVSRMHFTLIYSLVLFDVRSIWRRCTKELVFDITKHGNLSSSDVYNSTVLIYLQ